MDRDKHHLGQRCAPSSTSYIVRTLPGGKLGPFSRVFFVLLLCVFRKRLKRRGKPPNQPPHRNKASACRSCCLARSAAYSMIFSEPNHSSEINTVYGVRTICTALTRTASDPLTERRYRRREAKNLDLNGHYTRPSSKVSVYTDTYRANAAISSSRLAGSLAKEPAQPQSQ